MVGKTNRKRKVKKMKKPNLPLNEKIYFEAFIDDLLSFKQKKIPIKLIYHFFACQYALTKKDTWLILKELERQNFLRIRGFRLVEVSK
ncbi:MAG: hypothetical protein N3D75_01000 [Candidatus Aenigmarchaeota archaeon]|nr:hypothetical protein [Candidatus Aenigmarchaeota archaeon]